MKWRLGLTRWIILGMGILTAVLGYLLAGYGPEGLGSKPGIHVSSVIIFLPTFAFLGTTFLCRRSVAIQRTVVVAAVFVGVLINATQWFELMSPTNTRARGEAQEL